MVLGWYGVVWKWKIAVREIGAMRYHDKVRTFINTHPDDFPDVVVTEDSEDVDDSWTAQQEMIAAQDTHIRDIRKADIAYELLLNLAFTVKRIETLGFRVADLNVGYHKLRREIDVMASRALREGV